MAPALTPHVVPAMLRKAAMVVVEIFMRNLQVVTIKIGLAWLGLAWLGCTDKRAMALL